MLIHCYKQLQRTGIAINVSVCMSVCAHISKTPVENVACFLLALLTAVAGSYSDGGEVLCCTSGFVDDVMLSRDAKHRYSNSHTYDFDDFITAFDEKTYQCQDGTVRSSRQC